MRLALMPVRDRRAADGPRAVLDDALTLIAGARTHIQGIVFDNAAASGPAPLVAAAFFAAHTRPLRLTIRGLALGVLNPVELAEQLATIDHACAGRLDAGLTVPSADNCAAAGIDPADALPRFLEGLELLRAMWSARVLSASGPHYRFGEIHPTLRPAQPGGPPLSLGADDDETAALAGRQGLGIHIGDPALLAAYRGAGGSGAISAELDAGQVSEQTLGELAEAGVEQVDLKLVGDNAESVATLRWLAGMAETSGP